MKATLCLRKVSSEEIINQKVYVVKKNYDEKNNQKLDIFNDSNILEITPCRFGVWRNIAKTSPTYFLLISNEENDGIIVRNSDEKVTCNWALTKI